MFSVFLKLKYVCAVQFKKNILFDCIVQTKTVQKLVILSDSISLVQDKHSVWSKCQTRRNIMWSEITATLRPLSEYPAFYTIQLHMPCVAWFWLIASHFVRKFILHLIQLCSGIVTVEIPSSDDFNHIKQLDLFRTSIVPKTSRDFRT